MRRGLVGVVMALGLAGGALGLVSGWRVAGLDEGTVIATYAELYARQTGGRPTDCVGMPGGDGVWLVVRCAGDGSGRATFHVSRRGRLLEPTGQGGI